MKRSIFIIAFLIFSFSLSVLHAQVGINSDNTDPDASAMLDVKSTEKGLLAPRMTTTQRTAISTPANGLLVFDNTTNSFWFFKNSAWTELKGASVAHVIADADNDTKIQVEETPDEDKIKFDIGGNEILKMSVNNHGNLNIEPSNTQNPESGNLFLGKEAGLNAQGTDNTFVGTEVGKNNVGYQNTFFGNRAGKENTMGFGNTFLGNNAGYSNTVGKLNVVVGTIAGYSLTNGQNNLMLGAGAGLFNDGNNNVFIGMSAGENESGSNKLFIENSFSNSPLIYGEFDNDFLKINGKLEIGNGNLVLSDSWLSNDGDNEGIKVTNEGKVEIGNGNLVLTDSWLSNDGDDEGIKITNEGKVEIGNGNLVLTDSWLSNDGDNEGLKIDNEGKVSINGNADASAMLDIQSTDKGLLIPRMTTAQRTAIASPANGLLVFDNTTNSFWFYKNSAWEEMKDGVPDAIADADDDTKIQVAESYGIDYIRLTIDGTNLLDLKKNANGDLIIHRFNNNVFLGGNAGDNNTGSQNSFIGNEAGRSNTTGTQNSFVGNWAGRFHTTGTKNSFFGAEAGQNNTTGEGNVFLGFRAGQTNTTGEGNVFLGFGAGYDELGSNKLYIENSDSSTPLIYGEFDNDSLKFNGKVEIKASSGGHPLTVNSSSTDDVFRMKNAIGAGWHLRLQGPTKRDLGFSQSAVADDRLVLRADGDILIGQGNLALTDSWISNDGDSEGIRMSNSGAVGIDVHGDGSTNLGVESNGDITADILANNYCCPLNTLWDNNNGKNLRHAVSSRRHKNHITAVALDVDKYLTLQTKKWKFKGHEHGHEGCDGWDFGFIAEEVDSLNLDLPLSIRWDGQVQSLRYDNFMAYNFTAIKQHRKRIVSLEKRNEELQTTNKALLSKLEKMENLEQRLAQIEARLAKDQSAQQQIKTTLNPSTSANATTSEK